MRSAATIVCATLCALVIAGCGNEAGNTPAHMPDSVAARQADSVNHTTGKLNHEGIDTTTFDVNDTTITLRNDNFPKMEGKVVNVLVTGVDSRLGDPMGHADANHLMRFFVDSGAVEIISIPRDTPFDAGFDDTTNFNKLTNVRANRGRTEYMKAVCQIAGVPKIDFYVEFGFSQAIGLLELLGYKENATSTLRVLRSRQAYAAGDFQRVYNQGQFIRQALLRNVDKTTGLLGDLAVRAGLMTVETNMTYDDSYNLLESLRSHGFSGNPDKCWVRLKPAMMSKFRVYEFDSANVNAINREIAHKVHKLGLDSVKVDEESYEKRLGRLVDKAALDSAKSSGSVIRLLRRPFEQRAWLQIADTGRRKYYRDRICGMLGSAYTRTKNTQALERIHTYLAMEERISAGK